MKKVVMTFGRLNPPTVGHQKLVDKLLAIGKKEKADVKVFLSHTQNNKKDPLNYAEKIRFARKAFGKVIEQSNSKTIIQILQELQKNYTDLIMVVGSDRVGEFGGLLDKYNGKAYNFDSISVISAGARDPDSVGVEGMSASKLRALAIEGDFETFKTGLPKKLTEKDAQDIYDTIRSVIKEDMDEERKPLTISQRKVIGRRMKKLAPKLQRIKKMKAKRMANTDAIKSRAKKAAIATVRKKVAGDRGVNYKELSPSDKIQVDRLVQKKSAMVQKLAKKLIPATRKKEIARLKSARGGEKTESFDALFEAKIKNPESKHTKKFRDMFGEGEVEDAKRSIEREKEADKKKHDRVLDRARTADTREKNQQTEEVITEAGIAALQKKADKTGVSYDIIKKVYDRGMAAWKTSHRPGTTPQQWAFARVNSFLTGGTTQKTTDSDLWAKAKGKSEGLEEAPTSQIIDKLKAKTVSKGKYSAASKVLKDIMDRKKKEANGKPLKHSSEYYAAQVSKQYPGVNPRILAKVVNEEQSWRSEGHYTADGEEWKGDQHSHKGQVMTGKVHDEDSVNLYHYKELSPEVKKKVSAAMSECGAGEEGTDALVKKFKKDTPNA